MTRSFNSTKGTKNLKIFWFNPDHNQWYILQSLNCKVFGVLGNHIFDTNLSFSSNNSKRLVPKIPDWTDDFTVKFYPASLSCIIDLHLNSGSKR